MSPGDTSQERQRAREAVREWRGQHPDGDGDQLVACLSGEFPGKEWAVALRAMLYRVDLDTARNYLRAAVACGVTIRMEPS